MKKRYIFSAAILIMLAALSIYPAAAYTAQKLRVAINTETAPYSYVDESGTCCGLFIDLMDWIGEQIGYELEYTCFDSNTESCAALLEGDIDIVLGTLPYIGNSTAFQSTNALTSSSLCLVTTQEKAAEYMEESDFRNCAAAYEYGTVSSSSLYNLRINQYISCGSQEGVLKMVANGRAKIAIMNYESCLFFLQQEEYKGSYAIIRKDIATVDYGMLLRAEDRALHSSLNAAITQAKTSGIYEEATKKWIPKEELDFGEALRRIGFAAAVVIFTATSIIVLISLVNRILARKVTEKTAALECANQELDAKILALNHESRLRRDIIDRSRSGMVAFNEGGQITLINQSALSLAGLGALKKGESIHTIPLWGQLYEKLKSQSEQLSDQYALFGHPQEIELERGDQLRKYRCTLMLGSSVDDGELMMSAEDITEEARERQSLFEQEKNLYLTRFVAGIAHEIKNPLMSIRTAATLMRDMPDNPEVQQAVVQFLPDEVDRINRLVEGLVQYSRPVKGQQTVFELSEVVEECRYLLDMSAQKHPIRYEMELASGLSVVANRDKIKQSLINIILNGLQSMEERLTQKKDQELVMSIRAYSEDAFVVAVIRDEGMGMDKEQIKNCVNPFFTTKGTGTGLGLTLVRQYMAENGGYLLVESELGEYTQITLKFRRYLQREA